MQQMIVIKLSLKRFLPPIIEVIPSDNMNEAVALIKKDFVALIRNDFFILCAILLN